MKIVFKIVLNFLIFGLLTVLTQIGGIAFLFSEVLIKKFANYTRHNRTLGFIGFYSLLTFLVVPYIAPLLGREKIKHTESIAASNFMTVVLNRNYVQPELNHLLNLVAQNLRGSGIEIHYLDANFPFINKFPLLPHLSHNDGAKVDISLIYETMSGEISKAQKSISGYGVFAGPNKDEYNQISNCIEQGYFQYDYPKYLTFGEINNDIIFSKKGTKRLINELLKQPSLGKLFIEPHLKERLSLDNSKIRYHGCGAVRHDDHIHIQL